MYRKLRYHWKLVWKETFLFFFRRIRVKESVSHGYFTSRECLLNMLSRWSGSEWSYWESTEDAAENMAAQFESLLYLRIGFWGDADHHHEFNGVQPRWAFS